MAEGNLELSLKRHLSLLKLRKGLSPKAPFPIPEGYQKLDDLRTDS